MKNNVKDCSLIEVILSEKTIKVPKNTRISQLIDQVVLDDPKELIVAGRIERAIISLNYEIEKDCRLEFVTIKSLIGFKIYQDSLIFLLCKVCFDLFPQNNLFIEHSIGNGLYCILENLPIDSEEIILKILSRMKESVDQDIPFHERILPREHAIKAFQKINALDKVTLLRDSSKDYFRIYTAGKFKDHHYGPLVPSAGFLKRFDITASTPGFFLLHPDYSEPCKIIEHKVQQKLFNVFRETDYWANIHGINTIYQLNHILDDKRAAIELIQITEALHEKKIAEIADMITRENQKKRIVFIAGPSSSGKTTFLKRLSIHLKVNGMIPTTLSLDDYFLDREKTPRKEGGDYDFEIIQALNIDRFNQDIQDLLNGKPVAVPIFNFRTGKSEAGKTLKLEPDQVILIEGIHALNNVLCPEIPGPLKSKVYVSALTHITFDNHHRVSTTDIRIIRRLVRDHSFRGYSPEQTISRWPSVREGEEANIFRLQELADLIFNSALIYEIAVLKPYVEPLLLRIIEDEPQYFIARRLLYHLSFVKNLPDEKVPPTSILREFIGGSSFHY